MDFLLEQLNLKLSGYLLCVADDETKVLKEDNRKNNLTCNRRAPDGTNGGNSRECSLPLSSGEEETEEKQQQQQAEGEREEKQEQGAVKNVKAKGKKGEKMPRKRGLLKTHETVPQEEEEEESAQQQPHEEKEDVDNADHDHKHFPPSEDVSDATLPNTFSSSSLPAELPPPLPPPPYSFSLSPSMGWLSPAEEEEEANQLWLCNVLRDYFKAYQPLSLTTNKLRCLSELPQLLNAAYSSFPSTMQHRSVRVMMKNRRERMRRAESEEKMDVFLDTYNNNPDSGTSRSTSTRMLMTMTRTREEARAGNPLFQSEMRMPHSTSSSLSPHETNKIEEDPEEKKRRKWGLVQDDDAGPAAVSLSSSSSFSASLSERSRILLVLQCLSAILQTLAASPSSLPPPRSACSSSFLEENKLAPHHRHDRRDGVATPIEKEKDTATSACLLASRGLDALLLLALFYSDFATLSSDCSLGLSFISSGVGALFHVALPLMYSFLSSSSLKLGEEKGKEEEDSSKRKRRRRKENTYLERDADEKFAMERMTNNSRGTTRKENAITTENDDTFLEDMDDNDDEPFPTVVLLLHELRALRMMMGHWLRRFAVTDANEKREVLPPSLSSSSCSSFGPISTPSRFRSILWGLRAFYDGMPLFTLLAPCVVSPWGGEPLFSCCCSSLSGLMTTTRREAKEKKKTTPAVVPEATQDNNVDKDTVPHALTQEETKQLHQRSRVKTEVQKILLTDLGPLVGELLSPLVDAMMMVAAVTHQQHHGGSKTEHEQEGEGRGGASGKSTRNPPHASTSTSSHNSHPNGSLSPFPPFSSLQSSPGLGQSGSLSLLSSDPSHPHSSSSTTAARAAANMVTRTSAALQLLAGGGAFQVPSPLIISTVLREVERVLYFLHATATYLENVESKEREEDENVRTDSPPYSDIEVGGDKNGAEGIAKATDGDGSTTSSSCSFHTPRKRKRTVGNWGPWNIAEEEDDETKGEKEGKKEVRMMFRRTVSLLLTRLLRDIFHVCQTHSQTVRLQRGNHFARSSSTNRSARSTTPYHTGYTGLPEEEGEDVKESAEGGGEGNSGGSGDVRNGEGEGRRGQQQEYDGWKRRRRGEGAEGFSSTRMGAAVVVVESPLGSVSVRHALQSVLTTVLHRFSPSQWGWLAIPPEIRSSAMSILTSLGGVLPLPFCPFDFFTLPLCSSSVNWTSQDVEEQEEKEEKEERAVATATADGAGVAVVADDKENSEGLSPPQQSGPNILEVMNTFGMLVPSSSSSSVTVNTRGVMRSFIRPCRAIFCPPGVGGAAAKGYSFLSSGASRVLNGEDDEEDEEVEEEEDDDGGEDVETEEEIVVIGEDGGKKILRRRRRRRKQRTSKHGPHGDRGALPAADTIPTNFGNFSVAELTQMVLDSLCWMDTVVPPEGVRQLHLEGLQWMQYTAAVAAQKEEIERRRRMERENVEATAPSHLLERASTANAHELRRHGVQLVRRENTRDLFVKTAFFDALQRYQKCTTFMKNNNSSGSGTEGKKNSESGGGGSDQMSNHHQRSSTGGTPSPLHSGKESFGAGSLLPASAPARIIESEAQVRVKQALLARCFVQMPTCYIDTAMDHLLLRLQQELLDVLQYVQGQEEQICLANDEDPASPAAKKRYFASVRGAFRFLQNAHDSALALVMQVLFMSYAAMAPTHAHRHLLLFPTDGHSQEQMSPYSSAPFASSSSSPPLSFASSSDRIRQGRAAAAGEEEEEEEEEEAGEGMFPGSLPTVSGGGSDGVDEDGSSTRQNGVNGVALEGGEDRHVVAKDDEGNIVSTTGGAADVEEGMERAAQVQSHEEEGGQGGEGHAHNHNNNHNNNNHNNGDGIDAEGNTIGSHTNIGTANEKNIMINNNNNNHISSSSSSSSSALVLRSDSSASLASLNTENLIEFFIGPENAGDEEGDNEEEENEEDENDEDERKGWNNGEEGIIAPGRERARGGKGGATARKSRGKGTRVHAGSRLRVHHRDSLPTGASGGGGGVGDGVPSAPAAGMRHSPSSYSYSGTYGFGSRDNGMIGRHQNANTRVVSSTSSPFSSSFFSDDTPRRPSLYSTFLVRVLEVISPIDKVLLLPVLLESPFITRHVWWYLYRHWCLDTSNEVHCHLGIALLTDLAIYREVYRRQAVQLLLHLCMSPHTYARRLSIQKMGKLLAARTTITTTTTTTTTVVGAGGGGGRAGDGAVRGGGAASGGRTAAAAGAVGMSGTAAPGTTTTTTITSTSTTTTTAAATPGGVDPPRSTLPLRDGGIAPLASSSERVESIGSSTSATAAPSCSSPSTTTTTTTTTTTPTTTSTSTSTSSSTPLITEETFSLLVKHARVKVSCISALRLSPAATAVEMLVAAGMAEGLDPAAAFAEARNSLVGLALNNNSSSSAAADRVDKTMRVYQREVEGLTNQLHINLGLFLMLCVRDTISLLPSLLDVYRECIHKNNPLMTRRVVENEDILHLMTVLSPSPPLLWMLRRYSRDAPVLVQLLVQGLVKPLRQSAEEIVKQTKSTPGGQSLIKRSTGGGGVLPGGASRSKPEKDSHPDHPGPLRHAESVLGEEEEKEFVRLQEIMAALLAMGHSMWQSSVFPLQFSSSSTTTATTSTSSTLAGTTTTTATTSSSSILTSSSAPAQSSCTSGVYPGGRIMGGEIASTEDNGSHRTVVHQQQRLHAFHREGAELEDERGGGGEGGRSGGAGGSVPLLLSTTPPSITAASSSSSYHNSPISNANITAISSSSFVVPPIPLHDFRFIAPFVSFFSAEALRQMYLPQFLYFVQTQLELERMKEYSLHQLSCSERQYILSRKERKSFVASVLGEMFLRHPLHSLPGVGKGGGGGRREEGGRGSPSHSELGGSSSSSQRHQNDSDNHRTEEGFSAVGKIPAAGAGAGGILPRHRRLTRVELLLYLHYVAMESLRLAQVRAAALIEKERRRRQPRHPPPHPHPRRSRRCPRMTSFTSSSSAGAVGEGGEGEEQRREKGTKTKSDEKEEEDEEDEEDEEEEEDEEVRIPECHSPPISAITAREVIHSCFELTVPVVMAVAGPGVGGEERFGGGGTLSTTSSTSTTVMVPLFGLKEVQGLLRRLLQELPLENFPPQFFATLLFVIPRIAAATAATASSSAEGRMMNADGEDAQALQRFLHTVRQQVLEPLAHACIWERQPALWRGILHFTDMYYEECQGLLINLPDHVLAKALRDHSSLSEKFRQQHENNAAFRHILFQGVS